MSNEAPPQPVTAESVAKSAPPAAPLTHQQAAPPPVTYIDVVPSALSQGSMFQAPAYERFDVLVQRANEYLAANPTYIVLHCESTETVAGHNFQLTNDFPVFRVSGKMSTYYIRFLRLWVRCRGPGDKAGPSQIGYLNVVPAFIGSQSTYNFESFGQTIIHINDMFRNQPLPGKIINVETQDVKFETWNGSIDPDISFWRESGKFSTYFLNLIRIFYEVGQPCNEQIGCIDFVPAQIVNGFEPFYSVVGKAHMWMKENATCNVVSAQSINYKLDSTWGGGSLDTHRTCFRESGRFATYYVRILRVCYTTGGPGTQRPIELTYRTFVPVQLASGSMMSTGRFELLSETMARAQAWLRVTGAKPICAETVPVKIRGGQNGIESSEHTYTRDSAKFAEYYVIALRLYFDGVYHEPPPELLPPVPVMVQQQSSAVICNIL